MARNQQALQPAFWSVVQPLVVRIIRAASLSDDLNDTYFALRSLEALSIEEGGQILGERPVMERITSELQSEDAAIRKMVRRSACSCGSPLPMLTRTVTPSGAAHSGSPLSRATYGPPRPTHRSARRSQRRRRWARCSRRRSFYSHRRSDLISSPRRDVRLKRASHHNRVQDISCPRAFHSERPGMAR